MTLNSVERSQVMYELNRGKCGVCGDPWNLREPRPNEDGGKYGTRTVVRSYSEVNEMKRIRFPLDGTLFLGQNC